MIISSKEELLQEIDNMLGLKTHKTIHQIIFLCPNMNANLITHNNQSPQNLGQEIELLQEIDNMLGLKTHKTIHQIIFLCPNMNANLITHNNQSPQNLGQEILNKLQQTHVDATIHSFETLSQEQILGTKQSYSLPKHITIETYHNDNIIKTLLDSIKESAKINTANQYENLEAMLDDIKSENINKISLIKPKNEAIKQIKEFIESNLFADTANQYENLEAMLDDIKSENINKISLIKPKNEAIKQIKEFIESNLFADKIKAEAKANIEQLFNKLEQYIKQALKDKNNDDYKNIIKTIFGVILTIATGGGAAIILLGISAVLLSSLMDYQDAKNNKYSYIKNPIIEFLATELAMYIQLANTQLLSCMLIVESTQETDRKKIEFLDLSGFNLYLENTLLSCSQSIAFKGEFSSMIDIPNLLAQKAITPPTTQHNSIKAQMLYIHQNKTKQQNIKDVSLLTNMLQAVQYFNHLAYIESPHFNSALLAEICADKNAQYPNNHTTNMAKNYLIITNAPSKYNAKLTETITQHIIGNTIKDDINNRTKQELTLSRGGKNKSYNTTRDYSTYRIEINKKDNEPYMVQLSPFNNRTKQELTLSRGGKNKSYNTTRDYSTYRIEINKKDNEPYMVQLSPFVRAQLDTIKQAYENNSRYKDLNTSLSDAHIMDAYSWQFDSLYSQDAASFKQTIQEDIDALVRTYGIKYIQSFFKTPKEIEDIIKKEEQTAQDAASFKQTIQEDIDALVRTYGIKYIQSFFKTPKEIEDIIKKEEQTAKDFLTQLQYFHNGNTNLDNSLLAIFTLFYGLYVFKIHFPSFEFKSEIKGYHPYLQISCLGEKWSFTAIKIVSNFRQYTPTQQRNITIMQKLQEQLLLQTTHPKKTDPSKDFLDDLRKFINTDSDNNDVETLNDEIQKIVGIDLDKEQEQELAQIKNYGEKYAKIVEQERTQEVFYNSLYKILGIICPFMNFAHENMVDATKHCFVIFINAIEHLNKTQSLKFALYETLLTEIGGFMNFAHENMVDATKHCFVIFINAIEHLNKTQSLKFALYETLLTEIGGVLFLSYPTTIRVHIEINGGAQDISKELNNKVDITDKIKAKLTKLLGQKDKEQIQNFLKDFAQMELRRTKAQIAHFEAKTAFILDSIDKDAKTLKLTAIKEKLKQTMSSPKDKALIDKICFTYGSGKAQSHLIGELQAREIFSQAKQFYRNKVFYTLKINSSVALVGIALDVMLEYYFSTNYEAYAREYDSIMHKRYMFYYDLPYALKRKESVLEFYDNKTIKKERELTYYPMIVAAKFMSFDLQSMIYGTELCTGGLTHHIGLAYLLRQNKSDDLQEFLLTKLLSYLIIDEKRTAKDKQDYETHYNKQVPDYTFFHHKNVDSKGIITNTTSHISLNDIRKYQVPEESSLYQEFKERERKGEFHHKNVDSKGIITNTTSHISLNDIRKYQVPEESSLYQEFKERERKGETSAIDSYNEALEILAEYKNYYFTNTSNGKEDRNKARRLLECLNVIGQNNIRALYVGVNKERKSGKPPTPTIMGANNDEEDNKQSQEDKKRPKFIGRLATTIIIEDGLWLG